MKRPQVRRKVWTDANGRQTAGLIIRRDAGFVWIPFESAHEIADAIIDAVETAEAEKENP